MCMDVKIYIKVCVCINTENKDLWKENIIKVYGSL